MSLDPHLTPPAGQRTCWDPVEAQGMRSQLVWWANGHTVSLGAWSLSLDTERKGGDLYTPGTYMRLPVWTCEQDPGAGTGAAPPHVFSLPHS